MKIRNGFVSNSSSSSFVIYKKGLNKQTLDLIRKWLRDTIGGDYNFSEGKASWFGESHEGIAWDLPAFLAKHDIVLKSEYTEFNI